MNTEPWLLGLGQGVIRLSVTMTVIYTQSFLKTKTPVQNASFCAFSLFVETVILVNWL